MRLPEPVVRHARPADAEAIARVQVVSWQAAYAGIIPADRLAAMTAAERAHRHAQRLAAPAPGVAELVAERDRSLIGWASAGPCRDDDLDPAVTGEVYAMYADPRAWGTGVGTVLMATSLAHLRELGARRATLWVLAGNARGRAFYERCGFAPDGAEQSMPFGEDVLEVRYTLAWESAASASRG